MNHPRPATVGQLKETGYRPSSVKDEMRRNLIRKLRAGEELFPGIVGYRDSVIPQIVNGILSKHDLLFLGLRGQAKTRIIRMLPDLLDEWLPVLSGVKRYQRLLTLVLLVPVPCTMTVPSVSRSMVPVPPGA